MITITTNSILFLFIAFFNGIITSKVLKFEQLKLNFFEISLLGIVFSGFIAQIINFFYPINDFIIYLNLVVILLFSFFYKNYYKIFFLKKINFIILIFILLAFLNIYGSGFSDDLNHYHYGYIINSDKNNYIVGLSHLHHGYANSSIWLITHSFFNLDYSRLQDIHVVNGLLFFLILTLFTHEILKSINKKQINNYTTFILLILVFVLLKYTRLKEFGIDRPAFLIFYFFLYFYFKNFLSKNWEENLEDKILILVYLSLFLFHVKITFFFSGIIPIYYIIKNRKFKLFKSIKFIPVYIIVFSFFLKNILISGCLIYPVPFSCFESLNWNAKFIAEKWLHLNEVINKSQWVYEGSLNETDYIKDFNWLSTWINRNFIELLEFTLTSLIALIVTILGFKKTNLKIYKKNIALNKDLIKILLVVIFISFLFFILKNPVIRMSHYIFVLIPIVILQLYFSKFLIRMRKNVIYLIIIIAISFNISKNFNRIKNNDFINNPKKTIEPMIRMPGKQMIGNFIYYTGWYGNSPIGNSKLGSEYFHKKIFIFDIIFKN